MKYLIAAVLTATLSACGSGNPNTSWNTAGTGGMSPGGGMLPPCTQGFNCGGGGSTGTTGSSTTGTTGTTGTR